jgi:hypothetical protein
LRRRRREASACCIATPRSAADRTVRTPAPSSAAYFVGRRALPARDHGAGVAHALARGRGDARDVGDDGLRHLAVNVFRGRLFVRAADLADHDDAGRVLVAFEEREHFDEIEATHRVAADADAGRLAESDVRRLEDGLVRQRPGTRDDPDLAGPVDEARHDADLAFPGVMTPGQFGPTRRLLPPASAAFTRTMSLTGMPSVMQTMRRMPASAASRIASAA